MDRSILDVPITTGLDQQADVRELQASGAIVMQNCVMVNKGAVQKRYGNTSLAFPFGASPIVGGGGSYKGAPWVSSGYGLAEYAQTPGTWAAIDQHPEAVVGDRLGLTGWLSNPFDFDMCSGNGFFVTVLTADLLDPSTSGAHRLFWTATDATTGATVVPVGRVDAAMTAGAYAPKLCVVGMQAILTYVKTTAVSSLTFRKLDLTNVAGGWSAETDVNISGAGNFTSGIYDVAAVAGSSTLIAYVCEQTNVGNGTISMGLVNVAGAPFVSSAVGNSLETAVTSITNIAICADATRGYWAAYSGTAAGPTTVLRAWSANAALTASTPATIYTWTPAGILSPGRLDVVWQAADAYVYWSPSLAGTTGYSNMSVAFLKSQRVHAAAGAVGTIGSTTTNYGAVLYSHVQVDPVAGRSYMGVLIPSFTQGTVYLIRWSDTATPPAQWVASFDLRLTKYLANLMPSLAGGIPTGLSVPHIVADPATGANAWALPVPENTSPSHSALYAQRFDLSSQDRLSRGELYELEAISFGVPCGFDGQGIWELGFAHYPEVSVTAINGGTLANGTYSYICVWEWYDDRGQRHQSATSPAVSAVVSGLNDQVQVVVSTLALTMRRQSDTSWPQKSQPYLVIYRTTAGGSIYYRVTTDPPPSGNIVTFSGPTITFTDSLVDASLTGRPTLYTTGGQLDNYNPPAARCVVVHRNRWLLGGCAEPTTLWASKYLTPGECPGFNEIQNVQCSGAIRALASMDDKLVIFVQRGPHYGIEYMTGDGPLDTGAQSDWTAPQQVPSDTGAINQRGVCVGPFGVLFRGTTGGLDNAGGIFLLTRDLQVKYVSGPVATYIKQNPYVTSMVVHPRNGRVYITCAPVATGVTTGIRLVWDYDEGGVWSVDTLTDSTNSLASAAALGAFVATGPAGPQYHWVSSNYAVFRENATPGANAYTDGGAWITMQYQSAWLKPTKSGFARFWKAFASLDAFDPADLTMALTYDYAPSSYYAESHTWTAAQVAAFDRYPQADVLMTPGNQKAKAIQFTVSDAPPTGAVATTGQGFSLGDLALELGVKDGGYRNNPAAQRA